MASRQVNFSPRDEFSLLQAEEAGFDKSGQGALQDPRYHERCLPREEQIGRFML